MLMCNKKCGCPGETHLQSDNPVDHRECYQARLEMDDSPSAALASGFKSNRSSNDDKHPRVKLLCSFDGGIMPRPQDGKLRYVGGETRIVSLPRDINYEELMVRMRELYEGATLLKYQQPDEDLDALVSVVNDDDVTNMMEEYDKLGSGDGFIRLRVFLFSHPEQESSPLIFDVDEMDSERRYVDALNSLNDASDLRMQLQTDSSVMNSVEEAQIAEQFYNQVGLEGSIHNQRNFDTPIPQFNLHHLRIPHIGSGQHQQPIVTHRHNDMEASWSPAYSSPRHYGHRDSRPLTEFPPSPSSARLHVPLGDLPDKMQEEYSWQQVTQHSQCNHLPQFLENSAWFPSGAICGDRGGFPGNILHGSNVFEANNSSEHARMTFRRSQVNPDFPYNLGEQSQFEQSNLGNGVPQMGNQCAECSPSMGTHFFNTDPSLYHGMYPKEQNDPRSLYDEPQSHETRWIRQHHLNPQAEEVRAHGAGRVTMNFANGHGNVLEGHHVPPNCVYHEDPRYFQTGHDMVKEAFHDQVVAAGSHIPFPLDENGFQYENLPHAYGTDSPYQVSPAHVPGHDLCRNVQNIHNLMHGAPYEASNLVQDANGIVNPRFLKGAVEGSPRPSTGAVNQNTWVDSPPKVLGLDGFPVPDYSSGHPLNLNSSGANQQSQQQFRQDQVQLQPGLINFVSSTEPIPYSTPSSPSTLRSDKLITPSIPDYNLKHKDDTDATEAIKREQRSTIGEEKLMKNVQTFEGIMVPSISSPRSDQKADKISEAASLESVNSNCLRPLDKFGDVVNAGGSDLFAPNEDSELSDNHFSFLPKLLDSVKKAAVQGVEEVKARVEKKEGADPLQVSANKEAALEDSETANANEESELDSENANQSASATIEPTKAEEEAIARGLQTIKNDDLEEIREIGTGTYGAVYHGKWKGSDVAIKRIKASCFAGRPSERERLITDFWKEALILSSLHHPNVVSFYGIVRDGPDGSLATVTEFMVNGSLKQFLKKKDRTIDRRKRLIIAMDTAFGLEYLHGKNIVHFDLKCENLLVNMRDAHRPVCKIGDLGLSKVKQHTLVTGGVRGTLPWMAPELLTGKSNKVTEKIDVYSFGIVMWELLTGEEPYGDMHCASVIGGIVSNTLRPQIPTWCDPEWKSLMEGCWASDPAERPSFSEISQKLRTMAAAINVK